MNILKSLKACLESIRKIADISLAHKEENGFIFSKVLLKFYPSFHTHSPVSFAFWLLKPDTEMYPESFFVFVFKINSLSYM